MLVPRAECAKEWFMLVLSRKKDESIVINNDITIVVVEIRGDKVRLGVEAPKEVPVHRREVFEAIARGEPLDAAALAPPEVASDQASPAEPRPPATDAIP
jgi:carbon storage regulator